MLSDLQLNQPRSLNAPSAKMLSAQGSCILHVENANVWWPSTRVSCNISSNSFCMTDTQEDKQTSKTQAVVSHMTHA